MDLHAFFDIHAPRLDTPQALGDCLRHMVQAGLDQLLRGR